MSNSAAITPQRSGDEPQGVDELLSRYVDELNEVGFIDPQQVLADHPDLGPAVLEDLKAYIQLRSDGNESKSLGTLGDYTLRRQIGRGGMGVVYEAWENSMDRRVALKILPAGVAADPRAWARFLREAQTAGKLSHPNVVPVYFTGVKEQTPFYAMEFVEGETLAQVIGKMRTAAPDAPTPIGASREDQEFYLRVARAFADVADGLQHAHSKGITHRDIKPSNLILDGEGRLRILDFGLAHIEGQESLTASGDFLGTPLYMSPEQARRKKIPVDHRTDIYSVGATLYEMLVLRPPFQGKDHHDTLSQIIERDPVEPRKLNHRVPRDLETIVLKCLRKEAEDRYGTAEALGQDLRRFVRGDAIEARPEEGWERLVRRAHRHRWRILSTIVLGTLLAAVAWLGVGHLREFQARLTAEYRRLVLDAVGRIELASLARKAQVGESTSVHLALYAEVPSPTSISVSIKPLRDAMLRLEEAKRLLPGRPDARFQLARALIFTSEEEAASREVEEILHLSPGFVPAYLLAASLADRRGDPDKARELRTRAAAAAKDDGSRAWLLASRALEQGNWKGAEAAYGTVIDLEGKGEGFLLGAGFLAHMRRGQARLEAKDFAGALNDFAIAGTLVPGAVEPAILQGKVFCLIEKKDIAEDIFTRLHEAVERKDEVAIAIAAEYRDIGDGDKELAWIDRIEDEAERALHRCTALEDLGRFEDEIEAGMRAVELNPNNPMAHEQLGSALMWSGDYEGSVRERKEAIRLDPREPIRYAILSNLYSRTMNGREALKAIEAGLQVDRDYPLLLVEKAFWLSLQGDVEEGLRSVDDLVDRHLRDPGWYFVVGPAMLHFRAGRLEKAIAAARKSLEVAPFNGNLHLFIGWALESLGRREEAKEAYRIAAHRFIAPVSSSVSLGLLLEESGSWEEAVDAYCGALAASPEEPVSLRHIAAILRRHLEAPFIRKIDDLTVRLEKLLPPEKAKPLALQALAFAHAASPERKEKLRAIGFILRGMAQAADAPEIQEELLPALDGFVDILGEGLDLRLVEEVRAADPAKISEDDLRHLHVRLLERAGKPPEAAREWEEIFAAGARPGPLVMFARDLHDAGDPAKAEEILRKGLVEKGIASKSAWNFWASLNLRDLARKPEEILGLLPPPGKQGSPLEDLRWLLETIGGGGPILIDCAGDGFVDGEGRVWSKDRFFASGLAMGPLEAEIRGAMIDPLYQTFRQFGAADGPAAAYLVPLPRGQYRVTLHFVALHFCVPGYLAVDVAVEGNRVIENYDPVAAGCRMAQQHSFQVTVEDGILEIRFMPRKQMAVVSGIEIERLD